MPFATNRELAALSDSTQNITCWTLPFTDHKLTRA